jgi:hypothetical protein
MSTAMLYTISTMGLLAVIFYLLSKCKGDWLDSIAKKYGGDDE